MNRQPPRRSLFHILLSALTRKAPEQAKPHVQPPHYPTPDDRDAWHGYWKEQDQPWRTEPEIDTKRQQMLERCRAITPDIERGIYPFSGMKLSRADVEWLLATYGFVTPQDACSPVFRKRGERDGLDLRGAILRQVDLTELPLSHMLGGLDWNNEYIMLALSREQFDMAAIHLEEARLIGTYLDGAILGGAHLEKADLTGAYLRGTDLSEAELENANLFGAHLQGAYLEFPNLKKTNLTAADLRGAHLVRARLERAALWNAHLEGANLREAHLEGAALWNAHLEGVNLFKTHLQGADLREAFLKGEIVPESDWRQVRRWAWNPFLSTHELAPADLQSAFFDAATNLEKVTLGEKKYGFVSVVDVHWGEVNLSVLDWSSVDKLGDELRADQRTTREGKTKDRLERLGEYEAAVRANRQLAVALQIQGLNGIAAHFAYRAQVLQKRVFWFQLIQPGTIFRRRLQALGAWLFSWFLFLLAGYGYNVWRSLLAYLLVIGTFMALYLLLDPHLAWYEAIVVSMTAFHGRGFSPSTFSPGDPLSIASAVEAFVGLIIEVTFIAALTRRFFGQ